MTAISNEVVKGLDIWGIIQKYIDINEDWAVEKSILHLQHTSVAESFVDVHYFDLGEYIEPSKAFSEENKVKRFKLTMEDVNKMYSDIDQLVYMPYGVHTLHAELNNDNVVYFDVKFHPILK